MFENFVKDLRDNLAQIKEIPENGFKVIVSTSTTDRSWESIKQDGIDIERYMQNPVVLMNHDYRVESIVWKATRVWTEWETTYAEWMFSQTNPKARLVQDLYEEWMLKAVSIGFIPYERKDRDEIVKSEMLEFSFVAIPCNPEALDAAGKELYQKWIEAGLVKEINYDEEKKDQTVDFTFLGNLEEKELDVISKFYDKIVKHVTEKVAEDQESNILKEIKALGEKVDGISKTLTDDKVREEEISAAKAQKEALQNIDNAVWTALKNIKFLSK